MNVKNIFFDLDHTLWDFERNSACTFKLLFKNHNVNVDLDRFLDIYIPINLHYWKLYRNESISKEYLRYNRLNEAFSKLKVSIPSKLIHQLSDDYIGHHNLLEEIFDAPGDSVTIGRDANGDWESYTQADVMAKVNAGELPR